MVIGGGETLLHWFGGIVPVLIENAKVRDTLQRVARPIPLRFTDVSGNADSDGKMGSHETKPWRVIYATHLRIDSLFFGVFLAYLLNRWPEKFVAFASRFKFLGFLAGCLLLSPAFILDRENLLTVTVGFTLLYIGSGLVLISSLACKWPEGWMIPDWIASVGSNSYSIYLWHVPVLVWLIPQVERAFGSLWSWPAYFISSVIAIFTVGIGMAKLIEIPTLRVRDRWFPRRTERQK